MGLPPLKVSINVSRPQFESGLSCQRLRRALAGSGLPPQLLVVELTESMLMHDGPGAIAQMEEIKSLGVRCRSTISAPATRRCRT
jgi:diguanylate cyclase